VSKSGSSTPPYTSWETASDSIQKCINLCVNGDTIYVANGVYKENLVIDSISINLFGSSIDSTIIDGIGLNNTTIFFNYSNSIIEGFNIIGAGLGISSRGIILKNQPIIVKNCRISNAETGIGTIGVSAGISAYNLILNEVGWGIAPFNDSKNVISNCLININKIYGDAIHMGGPNPNSIHLITNNIILYTGPQHVIEMGIYCGYPGKVYIYNNLINGFSENIYIDGMEDTAFIKNNVLTGAGAGLFSDPTSITNNVVFNNNNIGIINNSVFNNSDYNIFWKNNSNFYMITAYGDSDLIADPMFVKDTIPTANGNYDFHLQAFSPGIDKGDPNILDFDGSRSDIGMYGGPFGETYTYHDLAPKPPKNLSAIVDSNYILVKWNKNTEADTAYYKVYRDTVSGFTIDSTKLVSSPKDTFFVQVNPHNVRRYVYKVTCVDKQGNESKPSTELVVNITSVFTNDYPMTISDYILYQNYPNPFNPSTKIGYQLKSGGYVKLMVYDIKGELVSVLVNKEQNAGYYEVEFNVGNGLPSVPDIPGLASGIYLYRIEVIGAGRIPVYTEMKKMLLIK
jgi:hypothetical protein